MSNEETPENPRAARIPTPDPGESSSFSIAQQDPHASPLGRKTTTGPQADTFPLSSSQGSIAGARGHAMPGQGADASDALTEANQDATTQARRSASAGINSESQESSH